MLRKVVLFIAAVVFVLTGSDVQAQKRKPFNLPKYDQAQYHFGFTLGINTMNFTVKPASDIHYRVFTTEQTPDLNVDSSMLLAVNSRPTFGFNVGIVGDMRLGRYLNVRFVPALTFGERYLNYSILGYREEEKTIIDIDKNISSVFVDFPVLFKYKSKRLNNMRAYLIGGAQYTVDLAANSKKDDDQNQEVVKLLKSDVYGILGVGFDFYNAWFKFGVELKMKFGVFDMIDREGTIYTDGIDRLTSKVLQVDFTFE